MRPNNQNALKLASFSAKGFMKEFSTPDIAMVIITFIVNELLCPKLMGHLYEIDFQSAAIGGVLDPVLRNES